MKFKVIKNYINKETKKLHVVGEEVDLTEKRAKEIKAKGDFLEDIPEAEEEAPEDGEKEVPKAKKSKK
jgi:hypothetical protein